MATVTYKLLRPKGENSVEKKTPVAILCDYYHAGIRVENISIGEYVEPVKWTGSQVKKMPRAEKINKFLTNLKLRLLDVHIDYPGISQDEHKKIVKAIIKGEHKEQIEPAEKKTSLITVWRFIAQYAREKEKGTVNRYKVLAGALKRFLKGQRLDFSQLDFNFYDQFKNFLYNTPNLIYPNCYLRYHDDIQCYVVTKIGDTPPTGNSSHRRHGVGLFDEVVFKYFINLKTVCKWVEKRGYNVHPAYQSWETPQKEYDPITLTFDELKELEYIQFTSNNVFQAGEIDQLTRFWTQKNYTPESIDKRLKEIADDRIKNYNIARDFLSLECRCGQRISDIKRFNKDDLKGDVWKFTQKKGNRKKAINIELPLDGFSINARLILEKYNYKLPDITEQTINKNIKEVCRIAGFTHRMYIERWAGNKKIRIYGSKHEFISTHTGKKTFITVLAAMGVPISILSQMTGTSQRTLERHYKGKAEEKNIRYYLKSVPEDETIMRKIELA